MRPRTVRAALALALLTVGALPDAAGAFNRTQGSSLAGQPTTFDCETRYLPDFFGTYQPQPPISGATCSMWMPGTTIDNTHLVPGTGTVTKVRIKSGPNPAPLRVTTARRLFQTNPNNPNEITDFTCCMGVYESATFTPKPNAVHEETVNLLVETMPSKNGASGWHDIVSLSAQGPGQMPVADLGPHSTSAGASTPTLYAYYPKFEKGASNQNQWQYPNWELLMQFDWTDGCPTAAGFSPRACTPPKTPPNTPPNTPPAIKAGQIRSTGLRLRRGKIGVAVKCVSPTKATCKGRVRLLTNQKKPRLLASKAVTLKHTKSATVSLALSRAARRKLIGRRPKVRVEINLGAQGLTTKTLTLTRA